MTACFGLFLLFGGVRFYAAKIVDMEPKPKEIVLASEALTEQTQYIPQGPEEEDSRGLFLFRIASSWKDNTTFSDRLDNVGLQNLYLGNVPIAESYKSRVSQSVSCTLALNDTDGASTLEKYKIMEKEDFSDNKVSLENFASFLDKEVDWISSENGVEFFMSFTMVSSQALATCLARFPRPMDTKPEIFKVVESLSITQAR